MLKFLVLSDIHLVEEGETSHGLDTYWRLAEGIETINTRYPDADFCVLAGDLADLGYDGAITPYARLKELTDRLTIPCHITIGNHDSRATYLNAFGTSEATETGYVDKVIDAKGYRVIVFDSVLADDVEEYHHGGTLADEQLDWLTARLAEHAGPVVVILHHHANPLMTMVDRINLDNGAAFVKALKTHSDVRQVIAGHVHYTSTALWHGIPFTTLAGSHYGVTVPLNGERPERIWGPAQMAVVLGTEDQTLIHFDNYLDGNARLG